MWSKRKLRMQSDSSRSNPTVKQNRTSVITRVEKTLFCRDRVSLTDALCIHRIYVKRLLLSHRVQYDNGVFIHKLSPPHHRICVLLLLRDTIVVRVDRHQTLQSLPKPRRERLVRGHTRADQGIATGPCGRFQHSDECDSRGLRLRGLVAVPLDWTSSFPGATDTQVALLGLVNFRVLRIQSTGVMQLTLANHK